MFPFNSSFSAQLQNISDSCGYTDYLDKFVTYPPAGQLPLPAGATFNNVTRAVGVKPECRLHSPIQRAVGMSVFFLVLVPCSSADLVAASILSSTCTV